jgi:hypothetical protein
MREDEIEVCNFNFESALEAHYPSLFTWRDARRHRHTVMMVSRQLALQEVGQKATANEFAAFLMQHRARLTSEAEYIIATRRGFARYRFPRR